MLKKLFLALLVLLVIAVGALFFLWRQAAGLPDWYNATTNSPSSVEEPLLESTASDSTRPARPEIIPPPATSRRLRQELKTEAAQGGTMRLDERELNALLQRALVTQPDGQRIRDATRAIHANIEGDRLAVGAVTDFDRLQAAARDPKERDMIGKLKRLAPWIEGREFYLGVEGQPRARSGRLTFDDVNVKIGKLSFAPARLLSLAGLPADRLDQELTVRLPEAILTDVRIEGDSMLLSLVEGSAP